MNENMNIKKFFTTGKASILVYSHDANKDVNTVAYLYMDINIVHAINSFVKHFHEYEEVYMILENYTGFDRYGRPSEYCISNLIPRNKQEIIDLLAKHVVNETIAPKYYR